MSLFSDETKKRCNLDDLIVEEIEKLPELEGCLVDDIPILETPDIIPVDGEDGCDGLDGLDAQDAADGADGRDGRDGCDAIDGFDAQDGSDGTDGTDGVDGKDGSNGCDGIDGFDAQDGTDGIDGTDGSDGNDGLDGFDAQDAADGADGKDGRDGCDAIDGFDAQDAVDGADGVDGKDGQDGCDAIDGFDAQDGTDGIDGADGQDLTGVCIKAVNISGRNLRFGSAVGILAPAFNKPPVDPPPGGGITAIVAESERYFYFEDRTYYVTMPHDDLKIGIVMESISQSGIGCIALSGIVRAVVDVLDLAHETVTFTPGTTDLESTDDAGQLSFLIPPFATGRQWCDLTFGVGSCQSGGVIKLGHLARTVYTGPGGGYEEGWSFVPAANDGGIPNGMNSVQVHPYFKDSEGNHVWSPDIYDDVYFTFPPRGITYQPGAVLYGMSSTTNRYECIRAVETGYLEVFEGWYDTGGMFRLNVGSEGWWWPRHRPVAMNGLVPHFANRATYNTQALAKSAVQSSYLAVSIPSSIFSGGYWQTGGIPNYGVTPVHWEQIEAESLTTGAPSVTYNASTGQVVIDKNPSEQYSTQNVHRYQSYDQNYYYQTSPKSMTDGWSQALTDLPRTIELGDVPAFIQVAALQELETEVDGFTITASSALVARQCLPEPQRNNQNHTAQRPAYVHIPPSGMYPVCAKIPLKIADGISYLQGGDYSSGEMQRQREFMEKARLSELRIFFFWTASGYVQESDTIHNALGGMIRLGGCLPWHFKKYYHPDTDTDEMEAHAGSVLYLELPSRTSETRRIRYMLSLIVYGLLESSWIEIQRDIVTSLSSGFGVYESIGE